MSISKAYYWIRRAKYHFDTNMTTSGSLHARKLLNKALEELEDSERSKEQADRSARQKLAEQGWKPQCIHSQVEPERIFGVEIFIEGGKLCVHAWDEKGVGRTKFALPLEED